MSGTTDHEAAVADLPENGEKFFFSLQADETGVTELKFRKDVGKLLGALFFSLDYINSSFDEPFPTLGDFLRNLAEIADKVREQATNNQAQEKEAGNEQQGSEGTEGTA